MRTLKFFTVSLVIILLDQWTKWLVVSRMELYESIPVLGDFFQITSSRNRGAAFGILQNQRWFFIAVTTVVVIFLIIYIIRVSRERGKLLLPVSLSLLLGGALGNFIDRVLHGEVVDFLKFRFQFNFFGHPVDYTFAIFNLADSAIVIGVGLFILDSLLAWRKEQRQLKRAAAGVEES